MHNSGQGFPIIGYTRKGVPVYAVAGGSTSTVDQAVQALASQAEGQVQPSQEQEAQPTGTEAEGALEASKEKETGGQDFIAPYLEGLEGETRTAVADRLEKFRKDSDSNANKKIQELSEKLRGFQAYTDDPEQLKPVVETYLWLMQEPQSALPWIVEELTKPQDQGGFGYDSDSIRDPLMEKLGLQQPPSGGPAPSANGEQPATGTDGQPLTRDDLESFYAEQQRKEQEAEQAKVAREEQSKKLNGWAEEALDKFKLKDRIPADSPMRQFIFQQAHQLISSRQVTNPQVAIETAVESVKNFLDSQSPSTDTKSNDQPKVANGGTPPQAPGNTDLKNPSQRKELAASMLAALQNQE